MAAAALQLGLLDGRLAEEKEQRNLSLSRFGGIASVPKDLQDNSVFLDALLKCQRCLGPSVLVSQMWATYNPAESYRMLYLTCCLSAVTQSESSSLATHNNSTTSDSKQTDSSSPFQSCCSMVDSSSWRLIRTVTLAPNLNTFNLYQEERRAVSNHSNTQSVDWPTVAAVLQAPEPYSTSAALQHKADEHDWLSEFMMESKSTALQQTTSCSHESGESHSEELKAQATDSDGCLIHNIRLTQTLSCIKLKWIYCNESKRKEKLTCRAEKLALEYERRKIEGIEAAEDLGDLAAFEAGGDDDKSRKSTCQAKASSCKKREWGQEVYEGASIERKLMRKFEKEVEKCPSQVIRYEFGGDPLWLAPPPTKNRGSLSNSCKIDVPKCLCSSKRVFEFQLMPNLLSCLQQQSRLNRSSDALLNKFIENSNWGILAAYSCSADCCGNQISGSFFSEEYLIVTPEI